MPGLLGWIPGWLPPTKMFWAYATTMGFFGAAVAILTGITAPLAARLLTAEIVIFELLVWIPNLSAGPSNHFNWAGNAICIALAGASLGCLRLHQRSGKNQTNPSRIPWGSKHPRLSFVDRAGTFAFRRRETQTELGFPWVRLINNFAYNYLREEQRVQALVGRSGSNIQAGQRFPSHPVRQEFCSADARQGTRYRVGGGYQKTTWAQIGGHDAIPN
jgi:hypothetical protein